MSWALLTLTLVSCVSAARRDLALAHDRIDKLRFLSRWTTRTCAVRARLTQPAAARYRQLYPGDAATESAEPLPYHWRASENACGVEPDLPSPVATDFGAVLSAGLCLLVQTHFVNSPFDEISVTPAILTGDKAGVLIRTGPEPDLGLKLDRRTFRIDTKTKSRGTLTADYAGVGDRFVPTRLAQRADAMLIEINNVEYALDAAPAARGLRRFTIGVGDEHALPVAEVTVDACDAP